MPCFPRLRHLGTSLALIAAIAAPALLFAAPSPAAQATPRRPRIGLALGGGSARGLAHVGVLEWLHEHRIPIDAIAGTSMGGLIGGAYAVGMTAPDIRVMTREIDWDAVMAAGPPFADNTFRRKQDRRAFPAGLQFGIRHGLWLPRSLNPGQRVALLLDHLTAAYSALPSFDDLPTPFRCVAFDVNRAERVVLGSGVLPEALRATMALPGIFPPVTIDGRLLIDGGVADNVPADVARGMQVDVVIAVDVGVKPDAEEDVTAFSMVNRTIDAVVAAGARVPLASADVVITPDVSHLTGLDWNSVEEWRARGYRAAEAQAAALLKYSVSQEDYDAHEAARLARRRTTPIVPVAVSVIGVGAREQADIVGQLAVAPHQALDLDRLGRNVLLLSGTDRYELVTYNLAADQTGERLEVHLRPKANGPAFLTLGVELNNTDSSTFSTNVLGRTTVYDAAGKGSEVRLDVVVGTRQAVDAELYRPLGVRWLFAAPHALVDHGTSNRFDNGQLVGEYGLTRAGAGLDVGLALGRVAEVRAGVDVVHVEEDLRVGDPALAGTLGVERVAAVQVAVDTQDSPVLPSRGLYARARARRFFAAPNPTGDAAAVSGIESPQRFWQAEFDVSVFHVLSPLNRMFVRAAGGTSFGAQPYFESFSLGGPFRMSAFRNDELRGANFALAGIGYIRQLPRLPAWVGGHAYLAAWVEGGSAFQSRAEADWHGDLSTGLIIDSIIGPVFAGGSVGPSGHHRLYISLGPLFK
jgi:NTE family protein